MMIINLNWDSSVANAPPQFIPDVEAVASFFESVIQNPITITIDVGYGEINGSKIGRSALGESETHLQQVGYSTLSGDLQSAGLTLPTSPATGKFYVSDAEAQALNIQLTNPPTVDGFIGFSSKSTIFDYTDHISNATGTLQNPNQYDFEGTVAHEISEVLGRIFLNGKAYSAYELFHYSSPGVQDRAANGGYFSMDGGNTPLAYFNAAHGGDGADWNAGGTSNSPVGGSAFDAFNAFGTAGQIAPVTPTDLLVLQALGFQLNSTTVAQTTTSGLTNTQTTVQNTSGSPSGSSSGLDHTVALFSQFMAAGFPEQHGGSITTNALSQVTTNEQNFLANPHHG
jgi:hypothetical protein